jgi:hypothetical protein
MKLVIRQAIKILLTIPPYHELYEVGIEDCALQFSRNTDNLDLSLTYINKNKETIKGFDNIIDKLKKIKID